MGLNNLALGGSTPPPASDNNLRSLIMKLCEMEPKIDALGLDKLEARLGKGGQVSYFLCAIGKGSARSLVVYNNKGEAYISFFFDFPSDISYAAIKGHGSMDCLFVDGKAAGRAEYLDLANVSI